jgi:hypothetical protein
VCVSFYFICVDVLCAPHCLAIQKMHLWIHIATEFILSLGMLSLVQLICVYDHLRIFFTQDHFLFVYIKYSV